jgi:hypothetical protein
MIINKLFFVTEKGYMGIAPWNVRVDDKIWVLLGSRVPFILRKAGVKAGDIRIGNQKGMLRNLGYVKLGDCYPHGIMQGEAVKGHEHERRTITLY